MFTELGFRPKNSVGAGQFVEFHTKEKETRQTSLLEETQ